MKYKKYLVGEYIANEGYRFTSRDGPYETEPLHAIDYGIQSNAERVAKSSNLKVIEVEVTETYTYKVL